MAFYSASSLVTTALLGLAVAFGSLSTLILQDLRRVFRRRSQPTPVARVATVQNQEEKQRRQDLIMHLMKMYSGVHSADSLSAFLNGELERRHESWRVRIPTDGPGEIYEIKMLE